MNRRSAFALGLALVALAFASPAEAATWFVDNDGADCPNMDYTSIQAAVASPTTLPGDTIQVCAGTYNESVAVNKNSLSIKAKGPAGAVVLDGNGPLAFGFGLTGVTGVLIEGFTVTEYHNNIHLLGSDGNVIRRNVTFAASDHDGIVVDQGSDANLVEHNVSFGNVRPIGCGISAGGGSSNNLIRHNEVFGNANAGILLGGGIIGSAGPGNVIEDNFSHDNGEPVQGVSRGIGILNAITPGSVIAHNHVQSNNAHGIVVTGATSTGVTVEHNLVEENGSTNDDDGIRLQTAAAGNLVRHNVSRHNRHDGIHLVDSDGNTIELNVLSENGTPGVGNGCGIDIEDGSQNNTVRRNQIHGHSRTGIRIRNRPPTVAVVGGNLVDENNVKGNPGYGILLENADSNTVRDNHSEQNGIDGLRADVNSVLNTFEGNKMIGNEIHDCHDDSVGTFNPPALVANMWIDNRGRTENRAGLCEGAEVTPPVTHTP